MKSWQRLLSLLAFTLFLTACGGGGGGTAQTTTTQDEPATQGVAMPESVSVVK